MLTVATGLLIIYTASLKYALPIACPAERELGARGYVNLSLPMFSASSCRHPACASIGRVSAHDHTDSLILRQFLKACHSWLARRGRQLSAKKLKLPGLLKHDTIVPAVLVRVIHRPGDQWSNAKLGPTTKGRLDRNLWALALDFENKGAVVHKLSGARGARGSSPGQVPSPPNIFA